MCLQTVVFMDEAGLPEESHESLKVNDQNLYAMCLRVFLCRFFTFIWINKKLHLLPLPITFWMLLKLIELLVCSDQQLLWYF